MCDKRASGPYRGEGSLGTQWGGQRNTFKPNPE